MLRDKLGFKSKTKYATLPPRHDSRIQAERQMDNRCPQCGGHFLTDDGGNQLMVCSECGYHHPLGAWERIKVITDEDSFIEFDAGLSSGDPLGFPGYSEKLARSQEDTGLNEAVITGMAAINDEELVLGVMESRFMMGSMGSVVGEKITRAFETARENRLPIVMFTASGGARMQEGMLSLMQMAKTSAAVRRFSQEGLFYMAVLTHPTTGGVTASFATLADIIVAEPAATIGFAGARVIEQTIRQKLPPGFQQSEFQLEHGMIDRIVQRSELKGFLHKMLMLHKGRQ